MNALCTAPSRAVRNPTTRGASCGFVDVDALAGAVAALSRFAAAHADVVESVDVNPFVALPEGKGGLALDALIVERNAA